MLKWHLCEVKFLPMITLKIHFFAVMEGERKIKKLVVLENGKTDFDGKIYVVDTTKVITKKKFCWKKITEESKFWNFSKFFVEIIFWSALIHILRKHSLE